jgi:hypothetical protein
LEHSKLNVEGEYKEYKKNLAVQVGLKKPDDIFEDIDKELKEVDLSSMYRNK